MGSSMPARAKARSTSAGRVGVQRRTPNAPETGRRQLDQAARRRRPATAAPSSSRSSSSCTSARQGRPACAHLGGDQRAGGLGRHEQPEAGRVRGRRDAGELVGVDRGQRRRARSPAGAAGVVEQRVLAVAGRRGGRGGGSGGTGAPVSRAHAAGSERGSPQRPAAPSSSASVSSTSWQPLDADAGAQQRRVDRGGRRPHASGPPGARARAPPRRGRSTADARSGRATAVVERRERRPTRRPPARPRPAHPPFNSGGTTTGYFRAPPVRPAWTWRWKIDVDDEDRQHRDGHAGEQRRRSRAS